MHQAGDVDARVVGVLLAEPATRLPDGCVVDYHATDEEKCIQMSHGWVCHGRSTSCDDWMSRARSSSRDPQHFEHEEILAWVGGEFEPNIFDLDEVSREFQRLRSPAEGRK